MEEGGSIGQDEAGGGRVEADGYTGAMACRSRSRWHLMATTKKELRRWKVMVGADEESSEELLCAGRDEAMARMVKVRGERVGYVVEEADRQGDEDRAKDRGGGERCK